MNALKLSIKTSRIFKAVSTGRPFLSKSGIFFSRMRRLRKRMPDVGAAVLTAVLIFPALGIAQEIQETPEYRLLEPSPKKSLAEFCKKNPDGRKNEKQKITYLLQRVRTSACLFDRNGKIVAGPTSAAFLQWKMGRPKLKVYSNSAGEFVKYIASKSDTSGKDYEVICSGLKRLKLGSVLREELMLLEKEPCAPAEKSGRAPAEDAKGGAQDEKS